MADEITYEITYYKVINDFSARDFPLGVVRRVKHEGGQRDEVFSGVGWEHTAMLYAAERGDTMNELIPITLEEAEQIMDRVRLVVSDGEDE
jgi:hypothetical protein